MVCMNRFCGLHDAMPLPSAVPSLQAPLQSTRSRCPLIQWSRHGLRLQEHYSVAGVEMETSRILMRGANLYTNAHLNALYLDGLLECAGIFWNHTRPQETSSHARFQIVDPFDQDQTQHRRRLRMLRMLTLLDQPPDVQTSMAGEASPSPHGT